MCVLCRQGRNGLPAAGRSGMTELQTVELPQSVEPTGAGRGLAARVIQAWQSDVEQTR